MARPLRIEFAGALYHITSRGDRRETIYADDDDREAFLGVLAEVVERYNWICHAFCLMTNHTLCEAPHKVWLVISHQAWQRQLNRLHTSPNTTSQSARS